MAFRRVVRRTKPAAPSSVTLWHGRSSPPYMRISAEILADAGIRPRSLVDVMIDDEASPPLIAVVAKGSEVTMRPCVGTMRSCQITLTRLSQIIPRMPATRMHWKIETVDGRSAVVITLPPAADEAPSALEGENPA